MGRWVLIVGGAALVVIGIMIGLSSPTHIGDTNCGNVYVDLTTRPTCADVERGWMAASVLLPLAGVGLMFWAALPRIRSRSEDGVAG